MQRLKDGKDRWNGFAQSWLWQDVLVPVMATRLILLTIGYLCSFVPPGARHKVPFLYTHYWFLDIWGRWDTSWYFDIIEHGYRLRGPIGQSQSNIAFFPLYPYLVKALSLLVPAAWRGRTTVLAIGLAVANLALVGALILLHRLITEYLNSREVAQRTVLYLLLFPAGFFFSAFYTESTFLFFSVLAFYAAMRKRWILAGLAAGLAALTRPLGVLLIVPLVWIYLEQRGWSWRKLRPDLGWLLISPALFGIFLFLIYRVSGDWLGFFKIETNWKMVQVPPWQSFFAPVWYLSQYATIDRLAAIGCLLLSAIALRTLPSKAYGLYALLMIGVPLLNGNVASLARYTLVVFPAFIVLAQAGRRPLVDRLVTLGFFALQVLFFIAWVRFYPVV